MGFYVEDLDEVIVYSSVMIFYLLAAAMMIKASKPYRNMITKDPIEQMLKRNFVDLHEQLLQEDTSEHEQVPASAKKPDLEQTNGAPKKDQ